MKGVATGVFNKFGRIMAKVCKILKEEGSILLTAGLTQGVPGLSPWDRFCDIHAHTFFYGFKGL
jgi:hypothetical protein